MQEVYDWEEAMERTRRSAAAASQNSERAVAGMVKLLREIDRHSDKIVGLTKATDRLSATQENQVARSQAVLDLTQSGDRGYPRLLALSYLITFAIGAASGGFIMN